MTEKTRVVARASLPKTSPLYATLIAWLLLDRIGVSTIVWGIATALFSVWWAMWLLVFLYGEEEVVLFKGRRSMPPSAERTLRRMKEKHLA